MFREIGSVDGSNRVRGDAGWDYESSSSEEEEGEESEKGPERVEQDGWTATDAQRLAG